MTRRRLVLPSEALEPLLSPPDRVLRLLRAPRTATRRHRHHVVECGDGADAGGEFEGEGVVGRVQENGGPINARQPSPTHRTPRRVSVLVAILRGLS